MMKFRRLTDVIAEEGLSDYLQARTQFAAVALTRTSLLRDATEQLLQSSDPKLSEDERAEALGAFRRFSDMADRL
jgi:hypothetical protein